MGHHRCRFVFIICAKIKWNSTLRETQTTLYAHTQCGYFFRCCCWLQPQCMYRLIFFFIVKPLIGFFYRLPTYFYVSKVDCIIKWMNLWFEVCVSQKCHLFWMVFSFSPHACDLRSESWHFDKWSTSNK